MYSEEDIDSAVAAGALSRESANALREHVAQLRHSDAIDEEHFRLISGFNDIFVVIACALLLLSVGWIGASISELQGAVAVAAVAWGLSEFFTRKRRMALPSIVLLLAFTGGVFKIGHILAGRHDVAFVLAGAMAAIAAWLHWRRFSVPITVAAGVAAIIVFVVTAIMQAIPVAKEWLSTLLFVAGLCAFFLAMRWDAADTLRQTRKSDVAFWLHLLAAPLLVHPVFLAIAQYGGEPSALQAVMVITVYIVIGFVSLLIDRRALMVSALGYVLYVFSELLEKFGVVSLGFAITALAIGSALLLLSAFWHTSRVAVLGRMPQSLLSRLPPLR